MLLYLVVAGPAGALLGSAHEILIAYCEKDTQMHLLASNILFRVCHLADFVQIVVLYIKYIAMILIKNNKPELCDRGRPVSGDQQ
jgi:hypothetical protein